MPIPRTVGRWNKVGLNRVTRRIAPWLPGFGVVVHRGRRSGRYYRTPVNVFPTQDGYLFALTYGPDTDWVRNVMAADGCELQIRGRLIRLVAPRLFHDERRRGIRPVERQILRLLDVADFLSLKTTEGDMPPPGVSGAGPAGPAVLADPVPPPPRNPGLPHSAHASSGNATIRGSGVRSGRNGW